MKRLTDPNDEMKVKLEGNLVMNSKSVQRAEHSILKTDEAVLDLASCSPGFMCYSKVEEGMVGDVLLEFSDTWTS